MVVTAADFSPSLANPPGQRPGVQSEARRLFGRKALGEFILLLGVTLAAYLPALRGTLLWDDSAHVTKPALRSLHGLARIWFELGATQQYYPVLHSAFWLEHRLWEDATLGYHGLNVVLHATAAWLFVAALRRLWGVKPENLTVSATNTVAETVRFSENNQAALFAGLIFALHPVCVESVAWISEQKNTLSTVFYLLAALTYLRFDARRRPADYAIATLLFVLALLSKSVTATLPAALLVIFWWRRGRLAWRRDVAPLLPWFVLAGSAGLVTAWVERKYVGAEGAPFGLDLLQRGLLAGRIVWFYLGKLLWPANLIFIYPHWEVNAQHAAAYLFPLGVAALLGALWLGRKRTRGPLAGLLFFVGSLFPALGFFNAYPFVYSYVADHFQYLATFGIIALAAAGWGRWRAQSAGALPGLAGLALLGVLAALTWRQCGTYRDLPTLYRTTLARNPACWMAHNNLGFSLVEAGQPAEAIPHFEAAIRLKPDYSQAYYNLAHELAKLPGRVPEAIARYEDAIRLKPNNAEAHYNLGVILVQLPDRKNEAIGLYEEAVRLEPDYVDAHYNLANQLAAIPGREGDAAAEYQSVLRLQPNRAAAHNNLANLLARMPAHRDEAIAEYQAALRLDPNGFGFRYNLALFLAANGRFDEAIGQLETILQHDPTDTQARRALAAVKVKRLTSW